MVFGYTFTRVSILGNGSREQVVKEGEGCPNACRQPEPPKLDRLSRMSTLTTKRHREACYSATDSSKNALGRYHLKFTLAFINMQFQKQAARILNVDGTAHYF